MPHLPQPCRCLVAVAFSLAVATAVHCAAQGASPATPATAEAHLSAGYEALRIERYDLAATEFRSALTADPTLAERARFPLAVALFEMRRSAESRNEFEALRRQLGDHPNIRYYLGRLDLEDNDFKGAVENLSKAASKPPFPDTAYYLGFACLKQHDLPNAEKWLKVAGELMPRDSRVEFQLAKVYREQGREEEAKQALAHSEELRHRDDNDIRLRQECAQKLDQNLKEEARAACQQLYDPDNADRLTSLGTIYGQHGDMEDALKCFQRAAELEPQSPQMQYNLALTYYQLNQFTKARAPLERALERWPDLFQLNALYGAVLAKLGEDASAYQALSHAHELNPQDSGTTDSLYFTALQLALKTRQAREYLQSLRYLQEAAKLRPDQAEPHRRMAEIYFSTAHADQATAEQREADRLNKNSPN